MALHRCNRRLIIGCLLGSSILVSTDMAAEAPTDMFGGECDKLYDQGADQSVDVRERIAKLLSRARECGGTGLYEAQLASLYLDAGDYEAATRIAKEGLRLKSDYEGQLMLALAQVEFRSERLDQAEKLAAIIMEKLPAWGGGYATLGEIRLVQGRFREAMSLLEQAIAREEKAGGYALLSVAYYNEARYGDAVASMQRALKMDMGLLRHTMSVVATAASLVEIGELVAADDLLNKHLMVKPEAYNDSQYVRARAFIDRRKGE